VTDSELNEESDIQSRIASPDAITPISAGPTLLFIAASGGIPDENAACGPVPDRRKPAQGDSLMPVFHILLLSHNPIDYAIV
jgi:hypothetical protein